MSDASKEDGKLIESVFRKTREEITPKSRVSCSEEEEPLLCSMWWVGSIALIVSTNCRESRVLLRDGKSDEHVNGKKITFSMMRVAKRLMKIKQFCIPPRLEAHKKKLCEWNHFNLVYCFSFIIPTTIIIDKSKLKSVGDALICNNRRLCRCEKKSYKMFTFSFAIHKGRESLLWISSHVNFNTKNGIKFIWHATRRKSNWIE